MAEPCGLNDIDLGPNLAKWRQVRIGLTPPSRLHWEDLGGGEGRFIGVAEWPDRATWQRAFDAKMVYDDPETRAAFVDAIADTAREPLLAMEVTDDLLDRR